jgi:hypothetical protein
LGWALFLGARSARLQAGARLQHKQTHRQTAVKPATSVKHRLLQVRRRLCWLPFPSQFDTPALARVEGECPQNSCWCAADGGRAAEGTQGVGTTRVKGGRMA